MATKARTKRNKGPEWQLIQAIKRGKIDLTSDRATNWKSLPPMPPSTIKMVLWDMDNTLLNTHTRGLWKDDIKILTKEVTRAFKILVPHLLHKNVSVGVVTFSDRLVLLNPDVAKDGGMAGEKLVEDLIMETFTALYSKIPAFKEHKELAEKNAKHIREQLYIAAALPKLRNSQLKEFKEKKMPNSKAWHIEKVIKDYTKRTGKELKHAEIMLFDDTMENVEAAWATGVHAFGVPHCFTSSCWEYALKTLSEESKGK